MLNALFLFYWIFDKPHTYYANECHLDPQTMKSLWQSGPVIQINMSTVKVEDSKSCLFSWPELSNFGFVSC